VYLRPPLLNSLNNGTFSSIGSGYTVLKLGTLPTYGLISNLVFDDSSNPSRLVAIEASNLSNYLYAPNLTLSSGNPIKNVVFDPNYLLVWNR